MKNESHKPMTLEQLARMVADGFEDISGQVRNVATKDDLLTTSTELKARLDSVESKLNKVDYRVDEIHDLVAHLEEVDILDLQKRVKSLEQTVKTISK